MKHLPLCLLGITVAAAVWSALPVRPSAAAPAAVPSLAGRILTVSQDEPPKQAAPVSLAAVISRAVLPPRPQKRRRSANRQAKLAAKPAVAAASVAAAPPAAPATAAPAVPTADTLDIVAEKFESDPAVFSMDRSVKAGGMTLHLLGLERLPAAYVLKVEAVNDSDADFYVKDLSLAASGKPLLSRSYFRILVESQRARQGYVVFQKPQTGAAVEIKLKEDGGKGRSLSVQVPYPF